MKIFFYLLPVIAGIAITVQSGINSQLRVSLQHPLMAAFISFIVGTLALVLLLIFSKEALPELSMYSKAKWYQYSGGLMGAFVVTVTLVAVSQIGAANMFVLIIAGQLTTAVVMDHFGILGVRESPINLQKLIGIALVVLGVYIVNRARV